MSTTDTKPSLAKTLLVALSLAFIPVVVSIAVPSLSAPAAYVLCGTTEGHRIVSESHSSGPGRTTTNFYLKCAGRAEADQPGSFIFFLIQLGAFFVPVAALALVGRALGLFSSEGRGSGEAAS